MTSAEMEETTFCECSNSAFHSPAESPRDHPNEDNKTGDKGQSPNISPSATTATELSPPETRAAVPVQQKTNTSSSLYNLLISKSNQSIPVSEVLALFGKDKDKRKDTDFDINSLAKEASVPSTPAVKCKAISSRIYLLETTTSTLPVSDQNEPQGMLPKALLDHPDVTAVSLLDPWFACRVRLADSDKETGATRRRRVRFQIDGLLSETSKLTTLWFPSRSEESSELVISTSQSNSESVSEIKSVVQKFGSCLHFEFIDLSCFESLVTFGMPPDGPWEYGLNQLDKLTRLASLFNDRKKQIDEDEKPSMGLMKQGSNVYFPPEIEGGKIRKYSIDEMMNMNNTLKTESKSAVPQVVEKVSEIDNSRWTSSASVDDLKSDSDLQVLNSFIDSLSLFNVSSLGAVAPALEALLNHSISHKLPSPSLTGGVPSSQTKQSPQPQTPFDKLAGSVGLQLTSSTIPSADKRSSSGVKSTPEDKCIEKMKTYMREAARKAKMEQEVCTREELEIQMEKIIKIIQNHYELYPSKPLTVSDVIDQYSKSAGKDFKKLDSSNSDLHEFKRMLPCVFVSESLDGRPVSQTKKEEFLSEINSNSQVVRLGSSYLTSQNRILVSLLLSLVEFLAPQSMSANPSPGTVAGGVPVSMIPTEWMRRFQGIFKLPVMLKQFCKDKDQINGNIKVDDKLLPEAEFLKVIERQLEQRQSVDESSDEFVCRHLILLFESMDSLFKISRSDSLSNDISTFFVSINNARGLLPSYLFVSLSPFDRLAKHLSVTSSSQASAFTTSKSRSVGPADDISRRMTNSSSVSGNSHFVQINTQSQLPFPIKSPNKVSPAVSRPHYADNNQFQNNFNNYNNNNNNNNNYYNNNYNNNYNNYRGDNNRTYGNHVNSFSSRNEGQYTSPRGGPYNYNNNNNNYSSRSSGMSFSSGREEMNTITNGRNSNPHGSANSHAIPFDREKFSAGQFFNKVNYYKSNDNNYNNNYNDNNNYKNNYNNGNVMRMLSGLDTSYESRKRSMQFNSGCDQFNNNNKSQINQFESQRLPSSDFSSLFRSQTNEKRLLSESEFLRSIFTLVVLNCNRQCARWNDKDALLIEMKNYVIRKRESKRDDPFTIICKQKFEDNNKIDFGDLINSSAALATPADVVAAASSFDDLKTSDMKIVFDQLSKLYRSLAAGVPTEDLMNRWNLQNESSFFKMQKYLSEYRFVSVQAVLSQVPNLFIKSSLSVSAISETSSTRLQGSSTSLALSQDWIELSRDLVQPLVALSSSKIEQRVSSIQFAKMICKDVDGAFPPPPPSSQDGVISIAHTFTMESPLSYYDDTFVVSRISHG